MTATVDAGKAHIDATLLQALTAEGVRDGDARELARMDAFGGAPAPQWIAGLNGVARLFNSQAVALDWGTLPEPWNTVGPSVANCNGQGRDAALADSIMGYRNSIRITLVDAISQIAMALAAFEASPHSIGAAGATGPKRSAAAVKTGTFLRPVDDQIAATVQQALKGKGDREQRRKRAGEYLVDWLVDRGRFIQVPMTGDRYYLHRDSRRLFNLSSDLWHAWLYRVTNANPASTNFRYLAADCLTASHLGESTDICRVAHWSGELLRISRFDGSVYRLDGETIELEANGDGPVIFEDAPFWTSYEPDFSANGEALEWWLSVLNSEGDADLHRRALRTWLMATFFTELCPTQVLLVLRGEAGSGKSMLLRLLMRLLYGSMAQIGGIPDKPDGFTASAAASHLLVLDNLDDPTDWLRDKLARITTGGVDHYRRLYSNNDLGTVRYRCWVAVTARTPDTLRRDDLADRVLMLPVARIDRSARRRESVFLQETVKMRSQFWGDLLMALNAIVASIRREGIPEESSMRMADFEALGRAIARAEGQEDIWERVIKDWEGQQATFLLEDSVITEALEIWLHTPTNRSRRLDTRQLYQELESCLFATSRPDRTWPQSARSFGRTLKALRRSLQSRFDVTWWDSPSRTYYQFDLLKP